MSTSSFRLQSAVSDAIEVKWYSTIFLLLGTILAVADPVTDILTLREFYLNDHKTWFCVGLVFVTLPSLVISCLYYRCCCLDEDSRTAPDLLFGWNPLSLPYRRFQAFILCSRNFKKLWYNETLTEYCEKKNQALNWRRDLVWNVWGNPGISSSVHNAAVCNDCSTGTSFNYPNGFLVCFFLKFSLDLD